LYASTLCVNILINAFALTLLADLDGAILLAFMLATGVSASINFLGMKFFVFKQSQTLERQ
jgi:putative flippase GtrA